MMHCGSIAKYLPTPGGQGINHISIDTKIAEGHKDGCAVVTREPGNPIASGGYASQSPTHPSFRSDRPTTTTSYLNVFHKVRGFVRADDYPWHATTASSVSSSSVLGSRTCKST
nr:hypothetical protein CFP56_57600 [Quercus suber]